MIETAQAARPHQKRCAQQRNLGRQAHLRALPTSGRRPPKRTIPWRTLALLTVLLGTLGSTIGCDGFFTDEHTTTTLTSSAATAVSGTSITLTAKVVTAVATGTVTFYDGTSSLGTGTLSSGTATLAITSLAVGTHSITAVYGGDNVYYGSTSNAVTVVISAALTASTTSLTSSTPSAILGASVTLTATLGNTAATGSVTFYNGTAVLGTVPVTLGAATLTTTALPAGDNVLTATYTGDTTDATSTSTAVTVTVTGSKHLSSDSTALTTRELYRDLSMASATIGSEASAPDHSRANRL